MRIAITGHRPDKLGNDYDLTSPLILEIKMRLQQIIDLYKPTIIITGMALGIDTLWAELAIENGIIFQAAIPCRDHESRWPLKSQKRYHKILHNPLCNKVLVSDAPYDWRCMQRRNEWMVNNSDILVAIWDGSAGGTANCYAYAEKVNKRILHINPKAL